MRSLVVLLGTLLIPALAAAQPVPTRTPIVLPEYETVYEAYDKPMVTTGALVFLGSYGASVVSAAASGDAEQERGIDRLYIPVVGPWLALNERGDCTATNGTCDWETTKKVLLVVDGVFQAGGVIAMIDGVLQPPSHRVVTTSAVRVTPSLVGAGSSACAGLAVFGHF